MQIKKRKLKRGAEAKPPKTKIPILLELFRIIDEEGFEQKALTKKAGYAPTLLTHARAGQNMLRLTTLEDIANAAGYKLALIRKDSIDG